MGPRARGAVYRAAPRPAEAPLSVSLWAPWQWHSQPPPRATSPLGAGPPDHAGELVGSQPHSPEPRGRQQHALMTGSHMGPRKLPPRQARTSRKLGPPWSQHWGLRGRTRVGRGSTWTLCVPDPVQALQLEGTRAGLSWAEWAGPYAKDRWG